MQPSRPLSLITGASSGIGAAFARELAGRGHDLVLVARREERLRSLADTLHARHGNRVVVQVQDLADPAAPQRLCQALAEQDLAVDWLINNAGYGVPGTFESQPWSSHADFLQVLVTAPAELVWGLLPGMRERGYGRIVNVASLAGLVPASAGHTLYAASKAFMIRFSQALALEQAGHGIHACALCPGFTRSEFHDVTGTRELMNRMPGFMWLSAEEVARQGVEAVERGRAVHVTGQVNRLIKGLVDWLPDRWSLALSGAGVPTLPASGLTTDLPTPSARPRAYASVVLHALATLPEPPSRVRAQRAAKGHSLGNRCNAALAGENGSLRARQLRAVCGDAFA